MHFIPNNFILFIKRLVFIANFIILRTMYVCICFVDALLNVVMFWIFCPQIQIVLNMGHLKNVGFF